ncbi:hypothetical protein RRF57_012012 [Xylaria bambusicola]|uniref:Uncharacterized protein n=1 Tax=Xylaria bambusicola TaxID=326684 RepID=A0AAN7UNU0_9PEZI
MAPRQRPVKTVAPLKVSQRRTCGVEEEKFLDRWSPKLDRDHYSRVRLHRERKDSVIRFRRRLGQRNSSLQRVRACENDDARSLKSYDSDGTSPLSPAPSFVFSDLGSTLQDELDHYDDQIKTLQPGEWPAPRARAFRVNGKEFSIERAKALKSWGFAQGMMYGVVQHPCGIQTECTQHQAINPGLSSAHHTIQQARMISGSQSTTLIIQRRRSAKYIGLEGKDNLIEYVSIRDAADKYPEEAEGMHNRLLAVGNDDFRGKIVAGKSCVKLTELTSHRYDVPATIEGKLEEKESDSKEELLALVEMLGT